MAKLKTVEVETVKGKKEVDVQKSNDNKINQLLTSTKKPRREPKFYISHHHGHGTLSGKIVVKKGDVIDYVGREIGMDLVANEGWVFGKKSEWKKLVRDV